MDKLDENIKQMFRYIPATYNAGDICPKDGSYNCKKHPTVVIQLKEGEKFPDCPKRHKGLWE